MKKEILMGTFGNPGDLFMTTRALAKARGVSVVTAQNIMVELREKGFIALRGKKYYLAHELKLEEKNSVTNILGMIVPNVKNEFHASMAKAIKILAGKRGYQVIIMDSAYQRRQEKAALDLLQHFGAAGIVSCPCNTPQNKDLYQNCQVPCVLFGHDMEGVKLSSVQVNSLPVAQKAAKHFIEQGYKNFLYFSGNTTRPVDDDRLIGFRIGLEKEGYHLPEQKTLQLPANTRISSKMILEMLQKQTEPVGIFCYHDLIAAQVARLCNITGISIPEQVGLIGFDDLPIATNIVPSLSTVQYRVSSMAEIIMQSLFHEIENRDGIYDNYYVEPSLIIRESSLLKKDTDN